jgi:hypothetical protein
MVLMRRFTKDELHEIRILAEDGASLKVIASKLKRHKSAIQYHAAKLRGRRAREKKLLIERLTDKERGWLIGCYAGDGSRYFRKEAYQYEVKFALNENEYPIVERVEAYLLKCGMKTRRSIDRTRVYVRCQSKKLFESVEEWLSWQGRKKSKSVGLRDVSSYSNDFLFGFLCGLIDADGGTKRLYISTSSQELTRNIEEICGRIGIATKTHEYDVFHISLNRSDFHKACQQYDFSSIKHRTVVVGREGLLHL